ncbi:MAG: Hpt domain-containing protein [Paracoccus sp. (in: a-proteobacteria)]
MSDISSEIHALLRSYVETINVEGMKILEESLKENPSIEFLCEATHKIKGGSGTAGFTELYQVTTSVNDQLKHIREHGGGLNKDIHSQLVQLQIILKNTKPEASTLFGKYM